MGLRTLVVGLLGAFQGGKAKVAEGRGSVATDAQNPLLCVGAGLGWLGGLAGRKLGDFSDSASRYSFIQRQKRNLNASVESGCNPTKH